MEKIKRKSLKFNKKIYKKSAIDKAIAAYTSFAQFGLRLQGDYFVVTMVPAQQGKMNLLLDEFSNHCLGGSQR